MVLIAFIELIAAIVCAICYFTGAWVPSATFIGFMFVAWVISCICALIREAKN
jgi:hypothetical protein